MVRILLSLISVRIFQALFILFLIFGLMGTIRRSRFFHFNIMEGRQVDMISFFLLRLTILRFYLRVLSSEIILIKISNKKIYYF